MREWDLTDGEITKAIQSAERDGHNTHSVGCYKYTTQAARCKLVEWLEKTGWVNRYGWFVLKEQEWQALRREVGL